MRLLAFRKRLNVNIKRKEREKNMEDWTYVC